MSSDQPASRIAKLSANSNALLSIKLRAIELKSSQPELLLKSFKQALDEYKPSEFIDACYTDLLTHLIALKILGCAPQEVTKVSLTAAEQKFIASMAEQTDKDDTPPAVLADGETDASEILGEQRSIVNHKT